MKMKRYLLPTLFLFIFALDISAQSLADAARKERDRQKTVHSKVNVVAGARVAPRADEPATRSALSVAPAAKTSEPLDNKGRNEKYWRTAFQKARDDAKRAEDRIQLLDLRLKDLNTKLLTRTDMYDRENRLAPEITATQKDLDDAKKEGAEAKQKISDLEDELRKSGGPAGWAR
jgi:chromosome segregation ATPase